MDIAQQIRELEDASYKAMGDEYEWIRNKLCDLRKLMRESPPPDQARDDYEAHLAGNCQTNCQWCSVFGRKRSMGFTKKASAGGGDFAEAPPAGPHPAVLVGLIQLGTQETEFQGKKDWKEQILLVWELTATKKSQSAENHIIQKQYTFSLNQKAALRKLIENWRGKSLQEGEDFDIARCLGKPCLVTVIHTGTGERPYGKIEGVGGVPAGLTVPAPTKTPTAWEITDPIAKLPDWLPFLYGESVLDVIKRSQEISGKGPPTISNPPKTNGSAPAAAPADMSAAAPF
jgi:hypothetical protein